MQTIIKSWITYALTFVFFSVCINLIYLALPVYMMVVYDRVLFSFSLATLCTMMIGVLFSLSMMGLIDYFRRRIQGQLGNMLAHKAMPFVVRSMHKIATEINQRSYLRGIDDLELISRAVTQGQLFFLLDLPWICIYLVILYFIHPLVGGVAACGLFLVAVFQVLLTKLESKRYTIADVAMQSGSEMIKTALRQAELIAGLGMLQPLSGKYLEVYDKVLAIRAEVDQFDSAIGSVLRVLYLSTLVAVFGAGAFTFFSQQISTGSIFAVVMITVRIVMPFERALLDMQTIIAVVGAFKRLRYFISLRENDSKISLPAPKGQLKCEAISLALNGRAVLQNISFVLEPGEALGIIGPSSTGKTSLCKILLGVWPPTGGRVRLDGAEITQWLDEELRQYVGYMPQEPILFPGTVAENIARFQERQPDKIVRAAQRTGVHEMVLKLPQGYDTRIDQAGKNLSLSQRQLISLARALYNDPKCVIMDEPHAYLDDTGLRLVGQTLSVLKQERITTIIVTDRSHFLAVMDKLLVMQEGQVAMYGPSKEVLGQLVNRQKSQQAV